MAFLERTIHGRAAAKETGGRKQQEHIAPLIGAEVPKSMAVRRYDTGPLPFQAWFQDVWFTPLPRRLSHR